MSCTTLRAGVLGGLDQGKGESQRTRLPFLLSLLRYKQEAFHSHYGLLGAGTTATPSCHDGSSTVSQRKLLLPQAAYVRLRQGHEKSVDHR